ncbi:MAG TPA: alkaline phosphatase [Chthoniobacterales bacterium]|nr:alkaline phosphatase [Chthoniobacterales bacterium]
MSTIGFATVAQFAEDQPSAQAVLSLTTRHTRSYIGFMKWRNQLLALFCLIAFAAGGVFYFQHWVVQKPFGIVLFIGEGLTPGRLAATRTFAAGADTPLALDAMPQLALLRNYSNDFAAPDQAAAATALATGVRVNNRLIGCDSEGRALTSLIELARRTGRATGLITNANLTDPTAAAFYAHTLNQNDKPAIARQIAEDLNIDLVLAGGAADFLPESKGGQRRDERDLLLEIRRNGFDLVRSKAELEALPGWRRPKLFGTFGQAELAYADQIEARGEQPTLSDMVRRAIELLQFNRSGYFLVVDAGLMRKAAEKNDGEHTLAETLELDRALAMARRYAGGRSLILVCGDVGIGGLSLNGYPFRKDRGIAVLGLNSAGDPWFSWASGPNGGRYYGAAKLALSRESQAAAPTSSPPEQPQEPAAFYASSSLNTVDDVVVFGTGPGAEALHGSLDSTELFKIIRDSF